MFMLTT